MKAHREHLILGSLRGSQATRTWWDACARAQWASACGALNAVYTEMCIVNTHVYPRTYSKYSSTTSIRQTLAKPGWWRNLQAVNTSETEYSPHCVSIYYFVFMNLQQHVTKSQWSSRMILRTWLIPHIMCSLPITIWSCTRQHALWYYNNDTDGKIIFVLEKATYIRKASFSHEKVHLNFISFELNYVCTRPVTDHNGL